MSLVLPRTAVNAGCGAVTMHNSEDNNHVAFHDAVLILILSCRREVPFSATSTGGAAGLRRVLAMTSRIWRYRLCRTPWTFHGPVVV
jgi:hypothetical protein